MSLQNKLKEKLELAKQQYLADQLGATDQDSRSSIFFKKPAITVPVPLSVNIAETMLQLVIRLNELLNGLEFSAPVDYIYNPTIYAFDVHALYIRRYCNTTKKIMFLGMNPGPWGMSQTGVPFGEISAVKDWLRIEGPVGKPTRELSNRAVVGFQCTRTEISGKRFWGLFKELCTIPENFFQHSIVYNYCPLALMKSNGTNITPSDLKATELKKLTDVCDDTLRNIVKLLQIEIVIGVGRFAEKRANIAFKDTPLENVRIVFLPHPSPRVIHNENWHEKAKKCLTELNLIEFFAKN